MKYRAEIDGLRALAVLPVILFHAGFETFSGGFVGVDVFFVISGYLITTIIISEIAEGKFSITNFYERRARRILPALFFVMAACLPFAWLWLSPSDFKNFGESLIAVSTFSSNILFWSESGYFDTAAELKPLLHTWSLAVEEQFYILFPIILMITWRLGMRWVLILLSIVFFISLGVAHWGAFNKPAATFFLLPTRVWELLLGVFAAFYLKYNTHLKSYLLNQVLSLLGFGMIIYSIVEFDKTTPFPSLYALIPTIGTGLLILCAVPKTFIHKLLSIKVIVGIGLISYSAYLWHQPLLAFTRHRILGDVSDTILIVLCSASFLMAWLSWRFVERPFRTSGRVERSTIFSTFFAATILMTAIGLHAYFSDGAYYRFDDSVRKYAVMDERGSPIIKSSCHLKGTQSDIVGCHFGSNIIPIKYGLVGDSHAAAIAQSLSEAFSESGKSFRLYTKNGCVPSLNIEGSHHKNCVKFNENVLKDIERQEIDTVIIFSRFFWYLDIEGFKNSHSVRETKKHFHYVVGSKLDVADQQDEKLISMKRYIERLLRMGLQVIFVTPVPETGWNIPKQKIASIIYQNPMPTLTWEEHEETTLEKLTSLKNISKEVEFVSTEQIFCDTQKCYGERDGQLLYFDSNHPSKYASGLIVESIMSSLSK